jgi:hypothetical protein
LLLPLFSDVYSQTYNGSAFGGVDDVIQLMTNMILFTRKSNQHVYTLIFSYLTY